MSKEHPVFSNDPLLETVVARYRDAYARRCFRGVAAFASPDIYTFLDPEEDEYFCAIRSSDDQNLQRAIAHLLTRPVGRPYFAGNQGSCN